MSEGRKNTTPLGLLKGCLLGDNMQAADTELLFTMLKRFHDISVETIENFNYCLDLKVKY